MKLDDYLKALAECSDEFVEYKTHPANENVERVHRLTWDFGVYGNWPILLNINLEGYWPTPITEPSRYFAEGSNVVGWNTDLNPSLVNLLTNWEFRGKPNSNMIRCYNHRGGLVGLQIRLYNERNSYHGGREEHIERQIRDYNIMLMLEGATWRREVALELAEAITDIGIRTKKEGLPLCFPKSIGWKEKGDDLSVLSKIVYYHPRRKREIKS